MERYFLKIISVMNLFVTSTAPRQTLLLLYGYVEVLLFWFISCLCPFLVMACFSHVSWLIRSISSLLTDLCPYLNYYFWSNLVLIVLSIVCHKPQTLFFLLCSYWPVELIDWPVQVFCLVHFYIFTLMWKVTKKLTCICVCFPEIDKEEFT